MHHLKYNYVKTCIESGMPIRLTSEAGAGKTTMAMQIAEELGLEFFTISCTKQMSVNALIGFISINGTYIPTQFRKAYESGALFLLDELDAADPNVLLALNTIENGYMAFPDGVVKAHPSFRLVATTNPDDNHSIYTGRSKLDFSTKDRYHTIPLERDPNLELHLTSQEVVDEITIARQVLESNSSSKQLTMRDAIRIHKLKSLGISTSPIEDVVFSDDYIMYTEYTKKAETIVKAKAKESMTQSQAKSIDELFSVVKRESTSTSHKESTVVPDLQEEAMRVLALFASTQAVADDWEILQKADSSSNSYGHAYTVKHISGFTRVISMESLTAYIQSESN